MTWFGWVLIAYWTVGVLLIVGDVGKPRKAITPASAVLMVIVGALLCLGALTVGTGRGL